MKLLPEMRNLVISLLILSQLSCVSYKKEIYKSGQDLNELKVGDNVEITLNDNEKLRAKIIMIDDNNLYVATRWSNQEKYNQIISMKDIYQVNLMRIDYGGLALGITSLGLIFFLIASSFRL